MRWCICMLVLKKKKRIKANCSDIQHCHCCIEHMVAVEFPSSTFIVCTFMPQRWNATANSPSAALLTRMQSLSDAWKVRSHPVIVFDLFETGNVTQIIINVSRKRENKMHSMFEFEVTVIILSPNGSQLYTMQYISRSHSCHSPGRHFGEADFAE